MKTFECTALGNAATLACHNLRPAADGRKCLTATGNPAVVTPPGHRPLLHFADAADTLLLTATGRELHLVRPGAAPKALGTLPAEPLCAVCAGRGVVVSTQAGMVTLAAPAYRVPAAAEGFPAVVLTAADTGLIRADVATRQLAGGDYRRLSALTTADARDVGADLRGAYNTLVQRAGERSVMMQPALARYALLDAEGNELFTSPPVLLGTRQCMTAQRLTCGSDGTLAGYALTASTWRPHVYVPAHSCPDVHSVRVWVTPQLHPVDPSEEVFISLSHNAEATTVSVRLHTAVLTADTVASLAARMDGIGRVAGTAPAAAGATELVCAPVMSPAQEKGAVAAALARPVKQAPRSEYLTGAPHGFSARCGAVSGDTVMWGNISPVRYAGYPAPMLAATLADEAWEAYVAVDFASGERVVWTGSGTTGAPATFGPLLSYPAPDAVRMRIGVRTASHTRASSFALSPMAGGRAAAFVHASLAPFALDDVPDHTVPPAVAPTEDTALPDTVIAAEAAAPLVAIAARGGFGREIVRMLPAAGSTASWDFGRTRMMAFGTGGIYSVALDSARSSLAAGRLDSRCTARGEAVAEGADGAVYAIAGGDLVAVGARGAATLMPACGFGALAWDGTRGELWCFDAKGACTVVMPGRRCLPRYTRDTTLAGTVAGPFVATPSGVADIRSEHPGAVDVAWRAAFAPAGGDLWRPGAVEFRAAGTGVELTLSLAAASYLGAEPAPALAARVAGDVRTPLVLRAIVRAARVFHAGVKGRARTGFSLYSISLR